MRNTLSSITLCVVVSYSIFEVFVSRQWGLACTSKEKKCISENDPNHKRKLQTKFEQQKFNRDRY